MSKYYVADFETTTKGNSTHVWAWCCVEVGNLNNIEIGTNIKSFLKYCKTLNNATVFFHNLKFDGMFLLNYFFKMKYEWVSCKKERKDLSFITMISDKGLWYQIEFVYKVLSKKVINVTFVDSLKLIPLSVDGIAKALKFPEQKLEIDYTAHDNLPEDSPLTHDEEEYIKHDVIIVAKAIEYFHSQGLNKMTIGSCALAEYKTIINRESKSTFKRYFPPPSFYDDIKHSYKGGFTFLSPKFKNKIVNNGVVLDVNSLYPSVMRYEKLPYGGGIFFKGKYKYNPLYSLYIQTIRCTFELKENHIPCIQDKFGFGFKNEFLTSGDDMVLILTSVDLELFLNQYNIYNIEYLSGYMFKGTRGLFNEYIDKWSQNKINAKKDKNYGLYLISKLFLNSLYGKFGTDIRMKKKIPYLDNEIVCFMNSEEEYKEGVYLPVASFITSYARRKTITSAQKITDDYVLGRSNLEFIYADTDSLHIKSDNFELPNLDIDDYKLGAWKLESKFNKGKYLRQKCYIENSTEDIKNDNPEYKLKVTVAGMPSTCHKYVTFENFKFGMHYKGKKNPKKVKGGVIIEDIDFTLIE